MFFDLKTRLVKISELFILSLEVYKKSFCFIALICLFVYVPMYTIFRLFPADMLPTLQDITSQNMEKILPYTYMSLGIYIIFTPLAAAGLTCVCRNNVEQKTLSIPAILDGSLIKWPKLLVTSLILAGILMLTSFLIVLPVYLIVCFAFYVNIIAITDKWGIGALLESRRILRGRWWLTATLSILVFTLSTLVVTALEDILLSTVNLGPVADVAVSTCINVLTAYFQIVITLYFLNIYYLDKR